MYRLLVGFFGLCAAVFYRLRRLEGPVVPATGPVVIVGNHPNGLIDPVLVARATSRRLRFLGKEPLFRMPVVKHLVRAAGVVPVHRPSDGGSAQETAQQNQQMFGAVAAALASGEAIALFPEGTTHDGSELVRMKTGVARMVLAAEATHGFGLGVQVVAVGLTFEDKTRFRSVVATEVGTPFTAADLAAAYTADPQEAVRRLTARVDDQLRAVTLNLDTWADLEPVRLAAQLTDSDEPDAAARRIGAAIAALDDAGPAGVARADQLRARLGEFGARLRELGVPPDRLVRDYRADRLVAFGMRNLLALAVGIPVALAGAVAYVVPYQLHRLVVALVRPAPVLAATVKVVLGVVLFVPWQALLTVLTVWQIGWWAVPATWLLLPAAGVYAVRFLPRRRSALMRFRLFLRSLRRSDEPVLALLRAERDNLLAELTSLS